MVVVRVNGYGERMKVVSVDGVEGREWMMEVWVKGMDVGRLEDGINIMFVLEGECKVLGVKWCILDREEEYMKGVG